MSKKQKEDGAALRIYLFIRPALQPVMRLVLRQRLKKGKEEAARYREKLGEPTLDRPDGKLIWIHAVGLGEVLALRPLVDSLQKLRPGQNILVTSSARSSAQVIAKNLPLGAQHQLLPLDGPDFLRRFLDHWRPDLSIWSEQDLWPGAIHDTAARGIPLAYVNARMDSVSYRRRSRLSGLYRDTLRRFAIVTSQDPDSAAHLLTLGASSVHTLPSLKPAALPLSVDEAEMSRLRPLFAGRRTWVAASTHADDEPAVIAAQLRLHLLSPEWLLILTPRAPDRGAEVAQALTAAGLSVKRRSKGEDPDSETAVLLADTFGELGLWYRISEKAFIGASMDPLGGHNPWEAICLGVPVLSGPHTDNFRADYEQLQGLGLAHQVAPGPGAAHAIADAIARPSADIKQESAMKLVSASQATVDRLAVELLSIMDEAA